MKNKGKKKFLTGVFVAVLHKFIRCKCGTCRPMPTTDESVCCMDKEQVWQKVVEQRPESHMKCVTEHPGPQSTCLDVWVLETAYYAYRQQYSTYNQTGNE